jgi:hypothetical protein
MHGSEHTPCPTGPLFGDVTTAFDAGTNEATITHARYVRMIYDLPVGMGLSGLEQLCEALERGLLEYRR